MKTTLRTFILAGVISAICLTSACSKKSDSTTTNPGACITTMSDSVQTGVSKTFSSCTAGGLSYTWNFGDGTLAATATATHTYATAGVYTGTLTVVNTSGQSSSNTFTITVKDPTLPANAAGAWTFKGVNFLPDSCFAESNGAYVYGQIDSANGVVKYLEVDFYNTLPTTGGTYTVVAGEPQAANQVAVIEDRSSNNNDDYYTSTGGNGHQIVSVTVTNGKLSISGSNIMLDNYAATADSSTVTFRLNQQY